MIRPIADGNVNRMKDYLEKFTKSKLNNREMSTERDNLGFTSVTRTFLSSTASRKMRCPNCGNTLNFASGMEWIGPDSFTCESCQHLINIRLIQRALRDLGVE